MAPIIVMNYYDGDKCWCGWFQWVDWMGGDAGGCDVTGHSTELGGFSLSFIFFFRSDQFEWNGGGIVWAGRNGLFHPPPPPAALHQMTTDAVDADGSQSALKSRFNFIKFHWVVDSLIDAGSFEGRPINSWRGRWEAGGKGGCSELVIIKF